MSNNFHPGVSDRVKAITYDGIVLVALMCVIAAIFAQFQSVSDNTRIIAFIFVFGLYDPCMTSFFGGTIGHRMVGLRVKRDADINKNISFPVAFIRYIIKAFLGWISLLTISNNEKGQAIHDFVAGSIIIYA